MEYKVVREHRNCLDLRVCVQNNSRYASFYCPEIEEWRPFGSLQALGHNPHRSQHHLAEDVGRFIVCRHPEPIPIL